MPWFLYLLECTDGSIYTGITTDVVKRYAAHASGKGARYTRARPPQRLLAVFEFEDRSSASKGEYELKQLTAGQKRALCAKYFPQTPVVDDAVNDVEAVIFRIPVVSEVAVIGLSDLLLDRS